MARTGTGATSTPCPSARSTCPMMPDRAAPRGAAHDRRSGPTAAGWPRASAKARSCVCGSWGETASPVAPRLPPSRSGPRPACRAADPHR
jgi:hypothetical protein